MDNNFYSVGTYKIISHQSYRYYLNELEGLIEFNQINLNSEDFCEMLKVTIPFLRDGQTLRSWYKLRSTENSEYKLIHCISHILRTIIECRCCTDFYKDNEELAIQFLRTLIFEIYAKKINGNSSLFKTELYWNTSMLKSKDMNSFIKNYYYEQLHYRFNNNIIESQLLQG